MASRHVNPSALGRRHHHKWATEDVRHRPCFICPANAVVFLHHPAGRDRQEDSSAIIKDNNEAVQQTISCPDEQQCVPMPQVPAVRPCISHINKKFGSLFPFFLNRLFKKRDLFFLNVYTAWTIVNKEETYGI